MLPVGGIPQELDPLKAQLSQHENQTMSLKQYVQNPEVKQHLKPLRPAGSRSIPAPLRVPPRSRQNDLLGTAFDYFLRFEIERRTSNVKSEDWVAATPFVSTGMISHWKEPRTCGEVLHEMSATIDNARSAHARYISTRKPNDDDRIRIAENCLRLARLEQARRSGILEPDFNSPSHDIADELVQLIGIVPYEQLDFDATFILNPSFGDLSKELGGADADVINGDLLLDLKVVKKGTIEVHFLDQLFGYFLLARRHRLSNPKFPEVRRAGLYFARHGYLWTFAATQWLDHPQFREAEDWFFANTALARQIASGRLLKRRKG